MTKPMSEIRDYLASEYTRVEYKTDAYLVFPNDEASKSFYKMVSNCKDDFTKGFDAGVIEARKEILDMLRRVDARVLIDTNPNAAFSFAQSYRVADWLEEKLK